MRRLPIWWFVAMFAAAAYCVVVLAFREDHPGGLHLVFELDPSARDERATDMVPLIEAALARDHIAGTVASVPHGEIALQLDDPSKLPGIEREIGDSLARVPCPATACFQLPSFDHDEVHRLLGRALDATRERLDEKAARASVFFEGDAIAVEIAEPDPALVAELRDLITRTAKLEMKVVDDCSGVAPRCTAAVADHQGSDLMKKLYARLASPDPAATAEITADLDHWRPEDGGGSHDDFYLRASDREQEVSPDEAKRLGCFVQTTGGSPRCLVTGRRVIERYLEQLAAADPSFVLPPGHEIGFERVEPPPDAKDRRPYWRTYYLESTARLAGAAVAKATMSYDGTVNRPIVILELTRGGGIAFGELTGQIVGMKLATVLNGTIKSAPIINGPIRGGRASITMGGSDPRRAERDAQELVAVIDAGAGAPLRAASVREFPGLRGLAWPKLVPGLVVLLGLVGFGVLRRRAA